MRAWSKLAIQPQFYNDLSHEQAPGAPTWMNFNPSMDKYSHT